MTRFRVPTSSSLSSCSNGSLPNMRSAGRPQQRPNPNDLETVSEDQANATGPSTANPVQAASQPAQRRDKGKGRARTPAKMDVGQKEQLRMAMKKAAVKPIAQNASPQWSFVYVGNLSSSVTDEQLQTLFKACGTIRRIVIRASGGMCVPTANMKRGFLGFGGVEPGVHYATVEYMVPASARRAIELSGTELDGRKILVSFSIVDLPETTNIIQAHITRKDPQAEKRDLWKAKFGQLKRLTIERTEYVPDPNAEPSNGGGPAKLVEGVARRLGLYGNAPAGPGSSAAGAHQNGARYGQQPVAKQQPTFPKTLK
ncbi:hypothetical protein BD413DRAFT_547012 [Trametes elegans]|nr:hypothetical protein BD413DRAFT_547012 [Trametes elegans]